MSRIGKKPVPFPKNVKITQTGRLLSFEGPKGKLAYEYLPNVKVSLNADANGGTVVVERTNDLQISRALHGTTRAIIANHIQGVAAGYVKELEIQGVGYKAELQGQKVLLSVGYANQITLGIPAGVVVKLEANGTRIHVSGPDKQAVGQVAADIRKTRKPEPYQGKGIRYVGEVVRRKLGKQFAGAGAK